MPCLCLYAAAQFGKEVERKALLVTMLKNAYPFIFDGSKDFNLERSTSASFTEKFKAEGVNGETVAKCEAFFLAIAQDAELKVSKLILDARKKGPKRTFSAKVKLPLKGDAKRRTADTQQQNFPEYGKRDGSGGAKSDSGGSGNGNNGNGGTPPPLLPQWYSNFEPVFRKLPDADKNPHWTKAERDKWLVAFSGLLDLYIEVDNGGNT